MIGTIPPEGDRLKRAISERRENKGDRFARAEVSTNRPRFRVKNGQFMCVPGKPAAAMNPASIDTR